jgi:hypothetical protein
MNGLRRDGRNRKKSESTAAATHANIALGAGLLMLCFFIFYNVLVLLNFAAKNRINFNLCK